MSRQTGKVSFCLCTLLFFSIALTGLTGYLQVRLDLHRFVFHKYLAYTTLILTLLHVGLHWNRIRGYVKQFLSGYAG